MTAAAETTARPVTGADFSTLFDFTYGEADLRFAQPPGVTGRDRANSQKELAALTATLNSSMYGDRGVPSRLEPIEALEAATIIAKCSQSPQGRDLLPIARRAAKLRFWLRRLDLEEAESAAAAADAELEELRRLASPDAVSVQRLLETVATAADAEAFLDGLAPRITSALQAHVAAERARITLRDMFDAAERARDALAARELKVGEIIERPEVSEATDNTLRVAESLRSVQGRIFSEVAMTRPVSRRTTSRRV